MLEVGGVEQSSVNDTCELDSRWSNLILVGDGVTGDGAFFLLSRIRKFEVSLIPTNGLAAQQMFQNIGNFTVFPGRYKGIGQIYLADIESRTNYDTLMGDERFSKLAKLERFDNKVFYFGSLEPIGEMVNSHNRRYRQMEL